MNVLILYSSTDGHTKDICEYISKIIRSNNKIEILKIENKTEINFSIYDLIIIGASIRYGTYRKNFLRFIRKNYHSLKNLKTAFFSVNLVARKTDKNSIMTNPYINKFYKLTKWHPDFVEVFAGKLNYPKYNFINKNIIRFIMLLTKGPIDTTRVTDFTDWDKVKEFALKINRI